MATSSSEGRREKEAKRDGTKTPRPTYLEDARSTIVNPARLLLVRELCRDSVEGARNKPVCKDAQAAA